MGKGSESEVELQKSRFTLDLVLSKFERTHDGIDSLTSKAASLFSGLAILSGFVAFLLPQALREGVDLWISMLLLGLIGVVSFFILRAAQTLVAILKPMGMDHPLPPTWESLASYLDSAPNESQADLNYRMASSFWNVEERNSATVDRVANQLSQAGRDFLVSLFLLLIGSVLVTLLVLWH